jgi:phage tail-like protein
MIRSDPIVARNFYLEIAGETTIVLQGVSALNVELAPVATTQNGYKGRTQHIKTVGATTNVPEVEMTRMAPFHANQDPIWKWFLDIRENGFKSRTDNRKLLHLWLYDTAGAQAVGEFTMYGAWPYKIVTDSLSTDSNDPMKETITFVCERVERNK